MLGSRAGRQTAGVTTEPDSPAADVSAPATDPSATAGRWRTLWTPSRARLWLIAAVVAAWLPALGMPLRDWLDFSAFYAAGSLAFTSELTELAAITGFQEAAGLPITPFVYPAGMALPYAPLSALPYGSAAAVHLVVMLGALIGAALVWAALGSLPTLPRRWFVLGALAWGPAAAGVISGQNTSVALLLAVTVAWALASNRQVLAGFAAGLLAYKPQLGAPMMGLLLLRTRWTALIVSVAVLGLHYLAGVLATGGAFDWPVAWLQTVTDYQEADFVANGWQSISLPSFGRQLEILIGVPGLTGVGYVIAGVILLACLPAMRRLPAPESLALAAACGLLISPHAWVYDATLLLPALAVMAARAQRRGWPWQDRWWLAAAYIIALTWPVGGALGFTLVPLLVLAAPFALLERGPFRPTVEPTAIAPAATPAS